MKFNKWLKEKPEFTEDCICICRTGFVDREGRRSYEYEAYMISEQLADEADDDNYITYMGWFDLGGDEYGDLNELEADEYFLIKI